MLAQHEGGNPLSTMNEGRITLGRYIVADPSICHGKPTFRGTRIFVSDILDQVAQGMPWESIINDWRGDITMEAIAEAVGLARDAFLTEYVTPDRDAARAG